MWMPPSRPVWVSARHRSERGNGAWSWEEWFESIGAVARLIRCEQQGEKWGSEPVRCTYLPSRERQAQRGRWNRGFTRPGGWMKSSW